MSLSREVTKVSLFLCSALRVNSVFTLCKCVSHVRGATAYVTPLSPPASALHGRFREGSPELGLLPRLPRSRTTVRVSLSAACSRSALSCVGRRLVGPLLRSCVSSASGVGAAGLVQSCCRSPAPTGSMHARGSSLLAQKSAPLPGGCTRGGADGRGASARGVVKHAGGPIIRAARTTRRREAMSRRPSCIVSHLSRIFNSVSRVVMAAPQRFTLWLTVALGLLQLNCAVSDDPTDPNKIVGHINYTPPRLGQN